MEKRSLPLNFYCRSARLLLKKATFSRKSNLLADELRHLKKFSTLAFSVIPSHPEYEDEKSRKLAEDLEVCMDDVRERIEELEEELCSTSTVVCRRSSSLSVSKNVRHVPKKQLIWEKFARKLYDATTWSPCFSSRANKLKKSVPPLTGFSTPSISELGYHEDEGQKEEENTRQVELADSESMASESTTRTQLMQQIAEATNLNMEGKLLNIQTIVMDLRDSVESLRTRIEDEGKRWRGRAESLERKFKVLKDETENEFSGLKRGIEEDLRKIIKEEEHRKESTEESKPSVKDVEEFKSQVNDFMIQTQNDFQEKFLESLSEVRTDVKKDINNLEIGLSKDVDNLRQEMASRYESLMIDIGMGRIDEQQQINNIMKQRSLSSQRASPSGDVSTEVEGLRKDVQSLHKDFDRLSEEHKLERAQVRKQLQTFKQEAMETRVDTEVWIKDCELQVKEARHDLIELKGEQEELKVDVEVLKKLNSEKRRSTPDIEEAKPPSEVSGNTFPLEFASNLLMVERVEKFSKLYTGCLDDLRTRVCNLEAAQKQSDASSLIETVEKERSLASNAATDALAAASKTKEMLHEAFATFVSQIFDKDVCTPVDSLHKEPEKKNLKSTVQRLNRQMKEIYERLTRKRKLSPGRLKQHGNEIIVATITGIDNRIKAGAGVLSQFSEKINRLETAEARLSRQVDEVRKGNLALKKSAHFWLPRYQATAKLVVEMESKLYTVEEKQKDREQGVIMTEKQIAQSTEIAKPVEGNIEASKPGDFKGEVSCMERLLMLEDRFDHIASATYANLRLLDAKVEHASIGMRSAVDIATETEDKCSSLGAELVKVFRLILSARESPKRRNDSPHQGNLSKSPEQGSLRSQEPGLQGDKPGLRSSMSPELGPPGDKSSVRSSKSPEPPPYNPLPTKPVKRLRLKFGEKGTVITNVPI